MIGYLATRSSVEHLEAVVVWGALFAATLRYATPLVFASIGGLFSERSGVVNIGLEGMMLMGAFFAVWGADVTGQWDVGLAIGMVAGGSDAARARLLCIPCVPTRSSAGTAINFLALGLTTLPVLQDLRDRGHAHRPLRRSLTSGSASSTISRWSGTSCTTSSANST